MNGYWRHHRSDESRRSDGTAPPHEQHPKPRGEDRDPESGLRGIAGNDN